MAHTQLEGKVTVVTGANHGNAVRFNLAVLNSISFFAALYFYLPILTLYYQSRGLSFLQINSLWGIIVATTAAFEIPTGVIADKVGRRCSIVLALFFQLLGEVVYVFAHTYWVFALVAAIAGIGFAFLSGSFTAMMYDTLWVQGRQGDMQRVSGLNASFAQLAFMASALVGGFIASNLSTGRFVLLIIMTATSVGIAFLASLLLAEPQIAHHHRQQSALKICRDSLGAIRTNRSLRRIVLLSLFATPFGNCLLTFYQPYFLKANVGGVWFGVAFALASLLGILASKYAYLMEQLLGVRRAALFSTLFPAVLYVLMAVVFHPLVAFILFVLACGSLNLQGPILTDYTNRHIESPTRATTLSLIGMLSGVYVALMSLAIGAIADRSLPYAFVSMGLVIATGAIMFRIGAQDVPLSHEAAIGCGIQRP